jgi:hypothetical protein
MSSTDDSASHEQATTFTQFPLLPTELQDMIIEFALSVYPRRRRNFGFGVRRRNILDPSKKILVPQFVPLRPPYNLLSTSGSVRESVQRVFLPKQEFRLNMCIHNDIAQSEFRALTRMLGDDGCAKITNLVLSFKPEVLEILGVRDTVGNTAFYFTRHPV